MDPGPDKRLNFESHLIGIGRPSVKQFSESLKRLSDPPKCWGTLLNCQRHTQIWSCGRLVGFIGIYPQKIKERNFKQEVHIVTPTPITAISRSMSFYCHYFHYLRSISIWSDWLQTPKNVLICFSWTYEPVKHVTSWFSKQPIQTVLLLINAPQDMSLLFCSIFFTYSNWF